MTDEEIEDTRGERWVNCVMCAEKSSAFSCGSYCDAHLPSALRARIASLEDQLGARQTLALDARCAASERDAWKARAEGLTRERDEALSPSVTCDVCNDTGWDEDREGRSVCVCIAETDAGAHLIARAEASEARLARLAEAAKEYLAAHDEGENRRGEAGVVARIRREVASDDALRAALGLGVDRG